MMNTSSTISRPSAAGTASTCAQCQVCGQFQHWADGYRGAQLQFTIVNDGPTDDTNKLGAIGDIHFVLRTQHVDDDLIVVAVTTCSGRSWRVLGVSAASATLPYLHSMTCETWSDQEIQLHHPGWRRAHHILEEKPQHPTSTLTASRSTIFPATLCLSSGSTSPKATTLTTRSPGAMALSRTPFYTWIVPGLWFDIGSKETLEEANNIFAGLRRS